ncbi:hypothetical protein IHN32_15735 [Deinococcus sp. 14RED07]|uniref:hypothetical protein n=1 Tax=Deinococcus sp. 14RED07 TaxID=2745874 RepID=UPI001E3FA6ED|nr:hypothetical protein [Deinococcus sp. 14RED07]MCD0177393.1 hypothetical protein [Deinococcus sp. 14RED07]
MPDEAGTPPLGACFDLRKGFEAVFLNLGVVRANLHDGGGSVALAWPETDDAHRVGQGQRDGPLGEQRVGSGAGPRFAGAGAVQRGQSPDREFVRGAARTRPLSTSTINPRRTSRSARERGVSLNSVRTSKPNTG